MLIYSTSLNHISFINMLNHLIQEDSKDIEDMVDLVLRRSSSNVDGSTIFKSKLLAAEAMLQHDHVESARKLLNDLRIGEIFKWMPSEETLGQVLNVHVFAGMPDRALEILDRSETGCQYDPERLIDQKIVLTWFMTIKCYPTHAVTIIKTLNPTLLTIPTQVEKLMSLNINLSRFSHVAEMIKIIQGNEARFSKFYIHLAKYYVSFGNIGKAEIAIINYEKSGETTIEGLLWKAKLLNLNGRHSEAIRVVKKLLNVISSSDPIAKCFGAIEKGNTHRALGQYYESLLCYQKATKTRIGPPVFWHWIAFFEQAMTFIYLDQDKKALQIAWEGCNIRSIRYNNAYNPCIILHQFLSEDRKQGLGLETFLSESVENAARWPFPFLPHKYWMLLLTAILADRLDYDNVVRKAFRFIYIDKSFCYPSKTMYLTDLELNTHSNYRQHFEFLSTVIFPNEFFWKVFHLFLEMKIQCGWEKKKVPMTSEETSSFKNISHSKGGT